MGGNKSLRALNQKYRGKPKKYADGGRVRRPAAAPVPGPADEDYLGMLTSRAVGGPGVDELRSAEGRGFAPMPRSFGEAGQRMSAVVRGDVEPTPEEERQINFVRGFTEGPASIRAYHGSPYQFDRFDISKIGTGEGNQTYGHGLYFAENPEVARHYRELLSSGNPQLIARVRDMLTRANNDENAAKKLIETAISETSGGTKAFWQKALNQFDELKDFKKGHMYEVNLRTEPSNLLSLDAPIAAQARNIRDELKAAGILKAYRENISDFTSPMLTRNRTPRGENIMSFLEHSRGGPEAAASALSDIGIPGLRYLDEGSRAAGRGTHNYVMFGDDLIDLVRRYEEGGEVRVPASEYDADEVDRIVQEFAEGGAVEAPAEATIGGQDHRLAYITDREAALLKARGGSGRMTRYGVRAYNDGNGDGNGNGNSSDNANSNSEASTQDAAGGNQGQGAGPTGAGAGGGPSNNDPGPTGEGQSEVNTPGMAPGISTAPTAVGPIGPEDEANAAAAKGAMANAPVGFEGYGVMDAIDAYNSGRMGLAQAIGYGLASVAAPPGVSVGFNVDPQTQTQTPAISVNEMGLIGGLMGLATGVPGASVIGGMIGSQLGQSLGFDPTVMSYEPGVFNAPEPTPAYGAAGYGMDYGRGYAKGGLADLSAKYAGGGEVEDDGGVQRYDPREIDAIAGEFMAETNPTDLMQRARMMMRGSNVGMPSNIGALDLSDNENASTYANLREMPIEDDRVARALRTLNTGINATLDQERGIRLGAGLQAMQDASDRGMSGYGANLSAGYGPLTLQGGYQSQMQSHPGAKPQGVYTYGGNLNIPLDDEGAKALLGAQVMSGRRGSAGMGNAGTLITGGLERPFEGGTLGVDVSVDPTLRNKEILFGYRRAF